jgi:hypothetical protein
MTNTILWQGTCDNLNLSGRPNADAQPMRITEDADGRLSTEFARATAADPDDGQSAVAYDLSAWDSDYQMSFRDMEPAPDAALVARLVAARLLDA